MKYLINKKINIFTLALFISIIPNITKAAFIGASAPVTATTSCNTGLSCGLVGYWTFDGKDIVNGVIKDVSGNGNNGNPSGIASSTFYTAGKIGQEGNFNGAANIAVPDHTSLKPSGAMSWGGWVYQKTTNVNQTFLSKVTTGTQGYMIYNTVNSSTFCFAYGLTPSLLSDGLGAVQTNIWVHYMCVYDGSTLKLYRNGALLNSVSVTGSITHTTHQLNIGSYDAGTRFIGKVDDVRIYNRALSPREVQQLYNMGASNKIGSTAVASSTNACTTGISCGLVGYWTFDGKDIVNGVILDKSGTGNNGNPVSIASSTFYAPGKIGQGANFNGYVRIPDNSSLKPSGPMSWGGWINQYTTKSNQTALSKVTIGTSGYMLYTSTTFPMQCFAYGLTPSSISDLTTFTKNTWVHYMCVYDGSNLKIYKNGVLINSTSVTGSITHTTNDLSLGSYGVTSTRFEGKADDLRVYNRALSAQEVQQLYSMGGNNKLGSSATASSTTACTVGLACGLVGYWTFDGKDINTNGVLLDKSGNGKNAYKVNISTTTLNAPGKIGQGANFDGVGYVSVGDNLDLIGSPFTLSAWIYPQSYSGTSINSPGVIDKLGTAGNYRLNVSLGVVSFGIRSSDNTFEGVSGTGNSAPLFKWTHVVVTYDNVATGKIYVNGVLNNSKTNFTVSRGDTAVPLLIGSNNNNPNSNFKGKIDDVRIYNRVLSDKEIQQLYSQSR